MRRDEDLIEQINALWLPVYPFIADHLFVASGLSGGKILDFGPFAGGIAVSLIAKNSRFHAKVVDESERVLRCAVGWARERGCSPRLAVQQASIEAIFEPDASFDLVTLRGGFFFITPALLQDVKRVLRPRGFGWVGGGYGPLTPNEVIEPLAERSRQMNEELGKRRMTIGECKSLLAAAGLSSCARISTEGGLWIEVMG